MGGTKAYDGGPFKFPNSFSLYGPTGPRNESTSRQVRNLFIFLFEIILWQYRLWSFKPGDTKLGRFLPKNQHTQRKFMNFENWCNGELLKIGHHFSNKVI